MVRSQLPPVLPPSVARRLRQLLRVLRILPDGAPLLARSASQRRHRLRPQRQVRGRPQELPGRTDAAPRFLRCRPRPRRPGPGAGRFRRRLRAAPPPHRTRRALTRALLQRRTDLPEARRDRGCGYLLPAGAERRPAVRRSPAQSRARIDVARPGRRRPQFLAPRHPREARTGADLFRTAGRVVGRPFTAERILTRRRGERGGRTPRRRPPSFSSLRSPLPPRASRVKVRILSTFLHLPLLRVFLRLSAPPRQIGPFPLQNFPVAILVSSLNLPGQPPWPVARRCRTHHVIFCCWFSTHT